MPSSKQQRLKLLVLVHPSIRCFVKHKKTGENISGFFYGWCFMTLFVF
jgi:hypothetical protein